MTTETVAQAAPEAGEHVVTSGSYIGTNPIWGDAGSPNAQDWLQVDLGAPTQFNTAKQSVFNVSWPDARASTSKPAS